MNRTEEFAEKCSRVRTILDQLEIDAVLIGSVSNFAWLTCGGSNYVGTATQAGSASVLVSADGVWVLCDNIEYPRIRDEELYELNIEYIVYPWYASDISRAIKNVIGDIKVGSDIPLPGAVNISDSLKACRYPLLSSEIDRYRQLGKVVGKCLERTARSLRPGVTENKAMAKMNQMLISNGIVPTCTLAAFDDRILRYRHPLPTDKPLENTAMLITGARKWGLIVSATRMVSLGKPDDELIAKHRCVATVDACFITSTRPGAAVGEVFSKAMQAYADCGYPDEWRVHHQGGPTGYEARDFKATADSAEQVGVNTAYAWNPSITGTKSEDTILILQDNNDIISETPGWPKIHIESSEGTVERPDILVL